MTAPTLYFQGRAFGLLRCTPMRCFGLSKLRSFSSTLPVSRSLAAEAPRLFAESIVGVEEPISEEQLFDYRRHRWLVDERNEIAKRYLKFNLPHLIEVAVGVCHGAKHCTKVLKCREGLHNKAFILTMNNGAEVFAKLPNPNAGPARYMTASEVATRQILLDVFKIPVPRVLASSYDSSNNLVQAEYIIEEKALGTRLGVLWPNLPWKAKLFIVERIAELDGLVSGTVFNSQGCIYFKKDLEKLTGKADPIQLQSNCHDFDLDQFALGPLTKAVLWLGGRSVMELDRGPWQEPRLYTLALATNESSWIRKHAKARMNYYRSRNGQELPTDALALIDKYKHVAPYLVPDREDKSASANVLWHPDLHLDNIFVDPDTLEITAIVDWQSAEVAPLFYQSGVHRAFRHCKPVRRSWVVPEKPENFDALAPEEQSQIDRDVESETIHKYYELQTMKQAKRHWDVLQQSRVPPIRKPVGLITGVWENKGLFFLRDSLIALVAQWDDLFEKTPCPISFSNKELQQHTQEEENMDGIGQMLNLFRDQGVLPADGMVDPGDYDIAVENCRKYREVLLSAAANEDERHLYSKLWPYQDVIG